jgi:hypothetical protein
MTEFFVLWINLGRTSRLEAMPMILCYTRLATLAVTFFDL